MSTLLPTMRDLKHQIRTLINYRKFFGDKVVHSEERIFNRIERSNDATIAKVFSRLEGKNNLLLKMDVEGGEYRVIDDLLSYESRITKNDHKHHRRYTGSPASNRECTQWQRKYRWAHFHQPPRHTGHRGEIRPGTFNCPASPRGCPETPYDNELSGGPGVSSSLVESLWVESGGAQRVWQRTVDRA